VFYFRLGPGTQRRGMNEHEMCEHAAKGKKFDDETTIFFLSDHVKHTTSYIG
jgi:hypothetical protein